MKIKLYQRIKSYHLIILRIVKLYIIWRNVLENSFYLLIFLNFYQFCKQVFDVHFYLINRFTAYISLFNREPKLKSNMSDQESDISNNIAAKRSRLEEGEEDGLNKKQRVDSTENKKSENDQNSDQDSDSESTSSGSLSEDSSLYDSDGEEIPKTMGMLRGEIDEIDSTNIIRKREPRKSGMISYHMINDLFYDIYI